MVRQCCLALALDGVFSLLSGMTERKYKKYNNGSTATGTTKKEKEMQQEESLWTEGCWW